MADLLYENCERAVRPKDRRWQVHGTGLQLTPSRQTLVRALRDALVLADSIATTPSVDAALAAYERTRRPHLRYYQRMTRWLTPFFQSDSRTLGWLRDWTFPIANAIGPLRRHMIETMAGVSMGFTTRPLELPLALKP